jgi:ribosome-associated translation inhibitor RaiA
VMHVVRGVVLKASGHSPHEARLALDGAGDKIEKQLRR